MKLKTVLSIIMLQAVINDSIAQELTPEATVRKFLEAYRSGDHQTFTSLLADSLTWYQPGSSRIAGIKRSKKELLMMGSMMSKLSDGTLKLKEVRYFQTSGNTVTCLLHWTAAAPYGAVLDVWNIDLYTVAEGKIMEATVYSEDIEQEDRFWGK